MRYAVFALFVAGLLGLAGAPVLASDPGSTATQAVYSTAMTDQATVRPVQWSYAYPGYSTYYYTYPGYSTYYYTYPGYSTYYYPSPTYVYPGTVVPYSNYYYGPYRYTYRPGWRY